MKYSIPVSLLLCCAFSATARAQDATAPVLADVTQNLGLSSSGQTSFGNLANFAHTETIDPTAPTASQTTAAFRLSSGGGSIVLSCPTEVTLTEPVSSAVMTFAPQLSLSVSGPDQSGSMAMPSCNTSGSGAVDAWFWLGGSLVVGSSQAPGSYSGVFTLSAAQP